MTSGNAPAPNDPVAGLGFAHAARLQFDEILDSLVTSAREVQATQGRLRGLLRAYLAVARANDLDEVLGHIIEAARTLVNARYAALGVVAGRTESGCGSWKIGSRLAKACGAGRSSACSGTDSP